MYCSVTRVGWARLSGCDVHQVRGEHAVTSAGIKRARASGCSWAPPKSTTHAWLSTAPRSRPRPQPPWGSPQPPPDELSVPRMEVQAAFTQRLLCWRALDSDAPSKDSVQNTCHRVCTSGAVRPSLSIHRRTSPKRPLVSWSMSDPAGGFTWCIFPSQLPRSEQADLAPPSGSTHYQ